MYDMAGSSAGANFPTASLIKVKEEFLDDEADTVQCRMCNKTFCSEIALSNHARLEHFEVYAMGDPEIYTNRCPEVVIKHVVAKVKQKALSMQPQTVNKAQINKKTEELISSMEPTSLLSLASNDVDYIIIKREKEDEEEEPTPKKTEKPKKDKPKKDIVPITGPFECFQPSRHVEDGLCHQIFFSCCEYSKHYRDEHTKRRKSLRCQVCEKFLLPGFEDPEYPYPCQVCGVPFRTHKELTDHLNTAHIKLKPYQCNICNKRFTQQGGLQQHMRMHTGDRPFTCSFCEKAFTQKSGLDQHLRIHTKIRPYKCIICDKAFCQSIHLKQHMRTHTNVAPFQCGICQKTFKQSCNLNYHLRIHNSADMSKEQKKKYAELLTIIDQSEVIEIEVDNEMIETMPIENNVQVESVDVEFTGFAQ